MIFNKRTSVDVPSARVHVDLQTKGRWRKLVDDDLVFVFCLISRSGVSLLATISASFGLIANRTQFWALLLKYRC